MSQFGDLYSQYYDLLYSDKDYTSEVDYVDGLIRTNARNSKTLLDLGFCGEFLTFDAICGSLWPKDRCYGDKQEF